MLAAALAVAGATDVADGLLARRTGSGSRLGQYLDGAADFSVGLALALTLAARGSLSPRLAALLVARWTLSPAYALGSYFGRARRAPLGSTPIGKAAGVAQAAVLAAGMLPAKAQRRLGRARAPLFAVAGALFVAAPLAHAWRAVRMPAA
jgi:phosphatidylglycerophosphate synthase